MMLWGRWRCVQAGRAAAAGRCRRRAARSGDTPQPSPSCRWRLRRDAAAGASAPPWRTCGMSRCGARRTRTSRRQAAGRGSLPPPKSNATCGGLTSGCSAHLAAVLSVLLAALLSVPCSSWPSAACSLSSRACSIHCVHTASTPCARPQDLAPSHEQLFFLIDASPDMLQPCGLAGSEVSYACSPAAAAALCCVLQRSATLGCSRAA